MNRISIIKAKMAERTGLVAARNLLGLGAAQIDADERKRRARMSNRLQKILFILLTLLVTAGGIGVALFLAKPTPLVFAVGSSTGTDFQFATKLAALVAQQSSRTMTIKVVPDEPGGAGASTKLTQGKADIAIMRADGKIPSIARAVALLEHDVVLLIAPKGSKIKSLSALKGRRVIVLGGQARDLTLVRNLLAAFDLGNLIVEEQPRDDLQKLMEAGK